MRDEAASDAYPSFNTHQSSFRHDEPGIADRADYDPTYDADAPIVCEICGSVMDYSAACRIVCRNCGYTRDCEDP